MTMGRRSRAFSWTACLVAIAFAESSIKGLEDSSVSIRSLRSVQVEEGQNDAAPTTASLQHRRLQRNEKPIIYTFFSPIESSARGTGMSDNADQELLTAWEQAWRESGWDPIVLNIKHAQQHRDFEVLNQMLDGLPFGYYDRLCFLRWLAMAAVGGGWMLDYDSFPLFPFGSQLPNEGRFTVHEGSKHGGVPSLASGSGDEWNRLAIRLIENAVQHKNDKHWSDMKGMQDLYEASQGAFYKLEWNVAPGMAVLTGRGVDQAMCDSTKGQYAVHFSHFAIDHGVTKDGSGPEDRAVIATEWLAEFRKNCLSQIAPLREEQQQQVPEQQQQSQEQQVQEQQVQEQQVQEQQQQVPGQQQQPGDVPHTPPPCNIRDPPLEVVVPATFTASYPGSGAKLTWKLIRAVTGMYTGDDHDHNGRVAAKTAVAVKTHFPAAGSEEVFFDERLAGIEQAIILIRNPLGAIPSYYNFMYEQENKLPNHSTRAPIAEWIKFRNAHVTEEVDNWCNHAKFWIERQRNKRFFLLPYEHLTNKENPQVGISTLSDLRQFFKSTDRSIDDHVISLEQVPCVWESFVMHKFVSGEKERRSSLRSGGPAVYPYTAEHLEYMIQALSKLRDEHQDFPQFYELMQEYLGQLVQTKQTYFS